MKCHLLLSVCLITPRVDLSWALTLMSAELVLLHAMVVMDVAVPILGQALD